ncbi:MAG: hypothetical protein EBS38_07780, partial [Actinobacteria bacterium]|nr:hypothetical protein [Actinomycetota bacterium]
NSIQVQLTNLNGSLFSSNSPVTLTSSAALILNGDPLSQSLTVNAVNGIATFAGLGFASTVTGTQTLTFSSDAFVGTSLTITPTFNPTGVNLTSTGVTEGTLFGGNFFASNSGTVNLRADDLRAHLQSFSTVISSSGFINVLAGFTSSSTLDLTLRAAGSISMSGSVNLTLGGGDLIVWSDADNLNGGYIRLETGVYLNTAGGSETQRTGGGALVLAGGLDLNADGVPDGYSKSVQGVNEGDAVRVGVGRTVNGARLFTGGGDLIIRGDSAHRIGINFEGQLVARSGNGNIQIYGLSSSTNSSFASNPHAIEFLQTSSQTIIESFGSAPQAIDIVGTSSSTLGDSFAVSFLGDFENSALVTAKGTGGIRISGSNSNSDAEPIRLQRTGIHAATASILIEARGSGSAKDVSRLNLTGTQNRFGSVGSLTSSANIVLRADSFSSLVSSSPTTISTSGIIEIEPFNSSFLSAFTLDNVWSIASGSGGLEIGKPGTMSSWIFSGGNASDVSIATNLSLSGPLSVYGQDVSLNSQVTTTGVAGDVLLRASRNVLFSANASVNTTGGDITLWADSDQSAAGFVRLLGGVQLCSSAGCASSVSGGGDITIGGGAANPVNTARPIGFAQGTSLNGTAGGNNYETTGVQLGQLTVGNTGTKIYSGGGSIEIRGKMTSVSGDNWAAGIGAVSGLDIRSGNGKILMIGETTAGPTGTNVGSMELNGWGATGHTTLIESRNTASDAIVLEGRRPSATNFGVWGGNSGTTISSAGGFQIRSDLISANLNLDISVSGQVVFESLSGSLSDSNGGSIYVLDTSAGTNTKFTTPPAGLRVGSLSNSNRVQITSSVTVAGPIEFIGGQIEVRQEGDPLIRSTALDANITLRARDWIDIQGNGAALSATLQTNTGDVILWADSNGDGSGSISLGRSVILDTTNGTQSKTGSGGGRITLGGSFGSAAVDADGHPIGSASDTGQQAGGAGSYALIILNGAQLFSGGGLISMRAVGDSSQSVAWLDNATIWSGTGQISAQFESVSQQNALFIRGTKLVSAASASPAITIDATSNTSGVAALRLEQNTAFEAVSLGNPAVGIEIDARSGGSTYALAMQTPFNLLSTTGAISISANTSVLFSSTAARNLGSQAGSDITSSSANINFVAQGFVDTVSNTVSRFSTSGVVAFDPAAGGFQTDSELQFRGIASTFRFGDAAGVNSSTKRVRVSQPISASNQILLAGNGVEIWTALETLNQASDISIWSKDRFTASSAVLTSPGTIQARAGSLGFSSTQFTGSGEVTIESLDASFSADQSLTGLTVGSLVSRFNYGKSTETRNLTWGTAQSLTGDVFIRAGGFTTTQALVTSGSGKRLNLRVDALNIGANLQASNTSRVEIAPLTSNRVITIAGNASGTLELTSSTLNNVRATVLRIGDTSSGNVNLASSYTFDSSRIGSLSIQTPGSVNASAGAILTAPNLAIDAGGGVNLPGSNS